VPGLLRTVGAWLGKADAGERWAIEVEEGLRRVAGLVRCAPLDKRTYLYLIWKEPYMVVSDDTYIAAMLRLIGLENVGGDAARYPTLSIADMKARSPDYLMFSSEPYPFRQRDMATLKTQWAEARLASGRLSDCAPRCLKVDGKLLSWYGTMTVEGLAYLTKIHGELAGLTDEVNQPF
jgi:ABC-type hemin transport system substrate-binding protein